MASFQIDPTHTSIGFTARHMMFAKVHGRFGGFTSELVLDPVDLTRSSVKVEIDASSIDTGVADRDNHLRSPDFLDAAKFPTLRFVSRSIAKTDDGYSLTGDLTIRDVTRSVTLEVAAEGQGKDPWGNQRLLYSAKTSIQRKDFGLTWNQALEAGGVLVSDKIEIQIEVQAVEQKG